MFQIDFSNQQTAIDVDEAFLIEVARQTLAEEQVVEAEISIAILDDATIRPINRDYLDHDYPPDVLSFPLEESCLRPASAGAPRGAGKGLSGEILIGGEEAARAAPRFGWPVRNEMALYLVHGLLHLCGYDDHDADEQRLMRDREQVCLKVHGIVPSYDERTTPQYDGSSNGEHEHEQPKH